MIKRTHVVAFSLAVTCAVLATSADAQSRRKNDKPTPEKLQVRAKKAEETLAKEYISIATGFYDIGDVEKAKDFLVRLNELREDLPGVREKIKELEEELMSSNEDRITIDVSKGWGDAIAEVTKGEAFRIVAAGDYKLSLQASLDVEGVTGRDPIHDMAPNVPFGALMGIIQGPDGKPSKPFAIRSGIEHSPRKSGLLYVRVNTPPGAKCTGRVKVQISGKVVTRGQKRKGKGK
ncbi:MAG: hypothetical protein AB8G99_11865 [Planctomycetaceae bacterium]